MTDFDLYAVDEPVLRFDPVADADAEAIRRDGYIVLPNLLEPDQVVAAHNELAPYLQGKLRGRNDFEGTCSERVYALLAKAPCLAQIVEHPRILAIVDRLLAAHYLLSANIAINVHPGETRQDWHFDDGFAHIRRPRAMCGVSCIWAYDDFGEDNGATEVIPGSHLWGEESPQPDDPRAEKILMPAGSVVVFAGSLFHRGGENRSAHNRLGITPQYCEPWLRQIENMVLSVPPAAAGQYSERVQELLGYSIMEPTFMGYVDGLHPKKLIQKSRLESDTAARPREGVTAGGPAPRS